MHNSYILLTKIAGSIPVHTRGAIIMKLAITTCLFVVVISMNNDCHCNHDERTSLDIHPLKPTTKFDRIKRQTPDDNYICQKYPTIQSFIKEKLIKEVSCKKS